MRLDAKQYNITLLIVLVQVCAKCMLFKSKDNSAFNEYILDALYRQVDTQVHSW